MSLVFSATARVGDIFNGSERTQILSNTTIMANKDIHFYTYSKEHCAFMSLILSSNFMEDFTVCDSSKHTKYYFSTSTIHFYRGSELRSP